MKNRDRSAFERGTPVGDHRCDCLKISGSECCGCAVLWLARARPRSAPATRLRRVRKTGGTREGAQVRAQVGRRTPADVLEAPAEVPVTPAGVWEAEPSVAQGGTTEPGTCTMAEDCPPPPPGGCIECADRTSTCVGVQCIEGRCLPRPPSCRDPIPCTTMADCPAIDANCERCSDGTQSCPSYTCEHNVCVIQQPPCGQVGTPCGGKRCGDQCDMCRLHGHPPPCGLEPGMCDSSGECGAPVVC